ncbi:conserved hypothetical protein [Moraxellaceae bacterium 17A]|nr:conserved hypothetical protein [Moraxellaceae bacterium 17A]
MITLFVYDKITGQLLYQDMGSINSIMLDLTDDKDFTLTQPPNYDKPWYWYNNQWNDKPSN